MRTSPAGADLIKEFEGLSLSAYKCPAGVWTIGYGHTTAAGVPVVTPTMTVTRQEAEEILVRDLGQYEQGVKKLVKVGLSQNQFDALVSFAYNAGIGALAKSTLLKRVNEGRFDDVPAEFMKWTRGGGKQLRGLVRRRRAEAKMWRGLNTEEPVPIDESRAEPDLPAPRKKITQSKEANGAILAGAGGVVAVAQEVIPVLREGGDLLSSLNGTAIACIIVVMVAIGIWYWRKQRLEEEGA